MAETAETKRDLAELNAVKNYTGVDFRNESEKVDPTTRSIIHKNYNDPLIIAKYLCKDNPNMVRIETPGVDSGNILYLFNGRYYDLLTEKDLDAMLADFCLKYETTKTFKSASIILRALTVYRDIKKIPKMNPYENLICVKNGVVDIYTKEIFAHDPKYYFDYALETVYDPEAMSCPNFVKFLNDALSGEQDTIENIVRLGGYLLDTSCKAEKCFFFDGNGGSGKSTLINTFTMFFPKRVTRPVVTSLSLDQLSENGFNSADLIYSRFNQCAETKKGYYDAEFLKKMVSGDLITVRRIYSEPFTFNYQGKVILVGNGLPRFNDTSDGIYRRIIIITFRNQYKSPEEIARIPYAAERRIYPIDTELFDKIKSEASSILNLFIGGLIDLRNNKYQFIPSKTSIAAMDDFRKDSDTVREFLEENYIIDMKSEVASISVFNEFRRWYMENVQDTKSMKFRSAEMGKRIKEVFGLESCGRRKFLNYETKKYELLTAYNLREKYKPQYELNEKGETVEIPEERARQLNLIS